MSVLIKAKILESDVAHYVKDEIYHLRLNDDGSINEEAAPVSEETTTPDGEQGTTEEGEAETATGIPASEAPGHTETLPEAEANPVTPEQ